MQFDLAGLPASSPAGAMHEQTFNEALAEALRRRRLVWRRSERFVAAERLRLFSDAAAALERPDILVMPPDIYPVVVEVEWGEPAFADARRKLGHRVVGMPSPVRSAIAVGAPPEARGWSVGQLRAALAEPDAVPLRMILLSASVRGDEGTVELSDADISVWPESGSVTGNVDDLAAMCEYAAAPAALVAATAANCRKIVTVGR